MALLGGLGAASWAWGARRMVDVSLARGEGAFEKKTRSSSARNGAWDQGSGLDCFLLFDGSVKYVQLAFIS